MRYFITFACYGGRLHGEDSGSVDRHHNLPGGPLVEVDPPRLSFVRQRTIQAPYVLDHDRQPAVVQALAEVCLHRDWCLLAAHVRTNHVHIVVEAEIGPEKIMNDLKSYASRSLNRLGRDGPDRRRWARHGSRRWLWSDQDVRDAIRNVVEEQGEAMAVFLRGEL